MTADAVKSLDIRLNADPLFKTMDSLQRQTQKLGRTLGEPLDAMGKGS